MTWEERLQALKGQTVTIMRLSYPTNDGSVVMVFSGAARLRVHRWRLAGEVQTSYGKVRLSSFDHGEQYGLPAPIDAIQELQRLVGTTAVAEARYDQEYGDLLFEFDPGVKLQILNLTGCEVWEIEFPDGTSEYSNYV